MDQTKMASHRHYPDPRQVLTGFLGGGVETIFRLGGVLRYWRCPRSPRVFSPKRSIFPPPKWSFWIQTMAMITETPLCRTCGKWQCVTVQQCQLSDDRDHSQDKDAKSSGQRADHGRLDQPGQVWWERRNGDRGRWGFQVAVLSCTHLNLRAKLFMRRPGAQIILCYSAKLFVCQQNSGLLQSYVR